MKLRDQAIEVPTDQLSGAAIHRPMCRLETDQNQKALFKFDYVHSELWSHANAVAVWLRGLIPAPPTEAGFEPASQGITAQVCTAEQTGSC